MSRSFRNIRSALLAATVLAPVAAHAQDATPEQAAQVQQQLRGWLATLLGPKVPLGDKPIQVTPEGDHLRLAVEIAGAVPGSPITVTGGPVTASVKQLDANRWSIENLRLPSPWRVDSAKPDETGFTSMSARTEEQTSHGVFDTTFATPSTFDAITRGASSATESASGTRVTSLAGYTSHTVLQPAPDGRVNMVAEGHGEKLATEGVLPDGTPFKFTADRASLGGHIDNVAFDQIGPMIRGVMEMMPTPASVVPVAPVIPAPRAPAIVKGKGNPEVVANAKQALSGALKLREPPVPATKTAAATSASAKHADMTPTQKDSARRVLAAFRAFMGGLDEEVAMENIRMESSGHMVSFGRIAVGFGFGAPGGRIDTHMAMALDGLGSPDIPAGPMRNYIPTHIALRPRASCVPANAVFALIEHAIDANGKDDDALTAEAMGLLAKGPLNLGIDDIALTTGPASLKGGGQVTIASVTEITGKAQFTMSGLDELIKQVNATPELQGMGAGPVLFLIKGMGRMDGPNAVWDITYADGKVMVNGNDLSAMIAGGK